VDAADEVEPSLEEVLPDESPLLVPPLAPSFPVAGLDELSLPDDAEDVELVPRESFR